MTTFKPGQVLTDSLLNTKATTGQVVFFATISSQQSLANNSDEAIDWDTPTIDEFSAYAAGNPSRFTPNVSGIYLLMGLSTFDSNATGIRRAEWFKNGASTGAIIRREATSSSDLSLNMPTYPISLNGSTDYIELTQFQNSGGALNTSNVVNPFVAIVYGGAG